MQKIRLGMVIASIVIILFLVVIAFSAKDIPKDKNTFDECENIGDPQGRKLCYAQEACQKMNGHLQSYRTDYLGNPEIDCEY